MVNPKEQGAVEAAQEEALVRFTVELNYASLTELLAFLEELRAKLKEVGAVPVEAYFSMGATVEANSFEAFQKLKVWAKSLADPLGKNLGVSVYRG